jgi:chlorite dismutase
MAPPLPVTFAAGRSGPWRVERVDPVIGDGLPPAEWLDVIEGSAAGSAVGSSWTLRGATSNTRYTMRAELSTLTAVQAGLRRTRATCAALIPIRKSASWWELAQDERRAIFEEQSRHIGIGLEYLPAVARRLHHCRELGEPFDFLTWFEYAPEDSDAFEDMVRRLRGTAEWKYIDNEIDVRLHRSSSGH